MLCGWTTKNYNRLTAALVGEMKNDIAHADTVLQNRLAAETAPANRWPRDDDLRAALLNKDMYGQRRQDRLVMVLWRIEEHLRAADSKVEQGLAAPSKLTLEHLIPQSWEAHWPLDEGAGRPARMAQCHLHRLGNLTLTTGPLNSSLSNLPWHAPDDPKDKRRSLVQHSLLKLNTTVVHNYPEHFDEHAVDDRGAFLTELITQLWPGPPASTPLIAEDEKSTDESNMATAVETASDTHNGTEPPIVASREAIRKQLQQGLTFEEICSSAPDKRAAYLTAIEEEARLAGELNNVEPNAANAVSLRDDRHLRWERIAARLFGDARHVVEAQRLYDEARGEGAAKRSYTGKGRHFPDMDPRSPDAAAGEPSQSVDAVIGQSAWSSREVDAAASSAELDDELFERVSTAIKPGDEITTLSDKRPNRIVSVERSGVEVETLRSDDLGSGPQTVPSWMIVAAWDRLRRRGELSQNELLNELNVKRSAFVCALLAQFPDVVVRSTRPTVLELISRSDQ